MKDYIYNMMNSGDFYLVCHDFYAYLETQERVERDYQDKTKWESKCLNSICRMGYFSSDRSINDYAENIWNVESIDVPKPELGEKRVFSSSNLKSMEKLSEKK
jgi:starch phosphorylase